MFNLIIKDIKNIIYDKKVLIVLVVMPIVLMTILGNALQGTFESDSGIKDIPIAIVKEYDFEFEMKKSKNMLSNFINLEDEIDISKINPEKIFFEDFLQNKELEFIKYNVTTRKKAEELLEKDEVVAIIILPKNYVYNFIMSMTIGNNKFNIELIKNPNYSFSGGIIEQILNSFSETINNKIAQSKIISQLMIEHKVDNINLEHFTSNIEKEVDIVNKELSGVEPIDSFSYYAAGIMCMFILYSASVCGKSLLEERKKYTVQRLEVAGIGNLMAATSNMVRVMIITIIQMIITIIYSTIVLGVNWGDFITVVLGLIFTAFAIGGIGMFISVATYMTEKLLISNIFEIVLINFMALIGGSFIPIQILPKFIQKMQILAVNGSAFKIYMNAMYHKPLRESYVYLFALLIIGLLFMSISFVLLRVGKRRMS